MNNYFVNYSKKKQARMQYQVLNFIVSIFIIAVSNFLLMGCNGSRINNVYNSSIPEIIMPNTSGNLNINLKIPQKGAKLSVTAESKSDIIDHVKFTITGDNIVGSIIKEVAKVDFVTALTGDTATAAIRIDNLLPGKVSVSIQAEDVNHNVIATATKSNITMIPGQISTEWMDVIYNKGSAAFGFDTEGLTDVNHVTFTVTGENIVGSIVKTVYTSDFFSTYHAAIQVDDLLPGQVSVALQVEKTDDTVITTAQKSGITIVTEQLVTEWL